jgi:hypothetical protein
MFCQCEFGNLINDVGLLCYKLCLFCCYDFVNSDMLLLQLGCMFCWCNLVKFDNFVLQFACIFCLRALIISHNVGQDTKISQCSSACTYLLFRLPLGFVLDNACNLLDLLGYSNQQGELGCSDVFANKRF